MREIARDKENLHVRRVRLIFLISSAHASYNVMIDGGRISCALTSRILRARSQLSMQFEKRVYSNCKRTGLNSMMSVSRLG